MTEVLDSGRLMQWAFEHVTNNSVRRERAFTLGRRIQDCEIPAYLVRREKAPGSNGTDLSRGASSLVLKEESFFQALAVA